MGQVRPLPGFACKTLLVFMCILQYLQVTQNPFPPQLSTQQTTWQSATTLEWAYSHFNKTLAQSRVAAVLRFRLENSADS